MAVTFWACPVCGEQHGRALVLVATPETYAREHAGVLPTSAELAEWGRALVRADVEGHLTQWHTVDEVAALASR